MCRNLENKLKFQGMCCELTQKNIKDLAAVTMLYL